MQQFISSDTNRVLLGIFSYYNMDVKNEELKQFWREDLTSYTSQEISTAFDEYRKSDNLRHRKPQPVDISRLIQKKRKAMRTPDAYKPMDSPPLVRSRGDLEDMLIDRIETMHGNNPHLMDDIRSAKSAVEKMMVCASALGDEKFLRSEVFASWVMRFENWEKEWHKK